MEFAHVSVALTRPICAPKPANQRVSVPDDSVFGRSSLRRERHRSPNFAMAIGSQVRRAEPEMDANQEFE